MQMAEMNFQTRSSAHME
ncbi:DUF6783 domain-containing protein [uncultured Robinsoniella sp.]